MKTKRGSDAVEAWVGCRGSVGRMPYLKNDGWESFDASRLGEKGQMRMPAHRRDAAPDKRACAAERNRKVA